MEVGVYGSGGGVWAKGLGDRRKGVDFGVMGFGRDGLRFGLRKRVEEGERMDEKKKERKTEENRGKDGAAAAAGLGGGGKLTVTEKEEWSN
ncbi:uncharacterized protein G2W53_044947 [Senna tora]|uniref:Uncharacterized protein n=1 Tax=Senna tora TaxID=362788 RepID=A0A834SE28_9FABA|nr:uncharacterized protein G2W53_044947 [Senna tora]